MAGGGFGAEAAGDPVLGLGGAQVAFGLVGGGRDPQGGTPSAAAMTSSSATLMFARRPISRSVMTSRGVDRPSFMHSSARR